MADRSVVYRILADTTGFAAGMAAAGREVDGFGKKSDQSNKKTKTFGDSLAEMGVTASTVGAVGIAAVVASSANFDAAMSSVQAATRESAEGMGALRQAALDAGADTAFSATEAAAGIENLAKAGVSTADIIGGGLAGALDLAAAGSLSVGEAAEFTATALTQFKLEGDQASHVADLLAAGAGKAQGEVSDMANALNYAGVPAAELGVTIEETAGTIALLAKNGIVGEQAGTSLRGMLSSLTSPSKVAAKEMERLGINVFDAQGKFLGLDGVAAQLNAQMGDLTDQERANSLGRIFGNEQLQAANVLYREGEAGVHQWTTAVNDQGFAAETASIKMDNLKGDLEELKGAFETALIEQGSDSQGPLRTLTQLATESVNLTTEAKNAGGAIGFLSGAFSDAAGGPLTLFGGKMADTKDAIFGAKTEVSALELFLDGTAGTTDLMTIATAKAAETQQTATSSYQMAGQAMQLTAEDAEALQKSLDDQRKAANNTATSFFNLGEGLNDAKVSLGGWIKQMESQADALRNFRRNAEEAANKGLRGGLIAALKEAGPEGAMRMRQLANASESEIGRANKAWAGGQREINKYVDATVKVPKSLSTKITVDSASAIASANAVEERLNRISDETVFVRVVQTGSKMGPQPVGNATGGYISGPGTGTSDSIPAYLSNGEYVIKAAAVNKYGTHMFDRLNAMHFADGGKVRRARGASADPRSGLATAESDQRAAERMNQAAETMVSAADQQAETVRQQRDQLESSVKSNALGGGLDFSSLGAFDKSLSGQASNSEAFATAIQGLMAAGLDGGLLQEVSTQGSLKLANQLLGSGASGIVQYEQMYAQAQNSAQSAATSVGANMFGQDQANASRAQVEAAAQLVSSNAELKLANKALQVMTNRLERVEKAIERSADRVGDKVNGAVVNGRREGKNR